MDKESMEPQVFTVPEGTTLRIITGSAQTPEESQAQASRDSDWSSMKYWGEPTPEQIAHEAAFQHQLEAHEAMQGDFNSTPLRKRQPSAEEPTEDDSFNRLSPTKKRIIQIGLIGAGVLTLVGVIAQTH